MLPKVILTDFSLFYLAILDLYLILSTKTTSSSLLIISTLINLINIYNHNFFNHSHHKERSVVRRATKKCLILVFLASKKWDFVLLRQIFLRPLECDDP